MSTPARIWSAASRFLTPVGGPGNSYRMPDCPLPWSVTPHEGRFLYEAARRVRHPAHAYEIATAFGYSALWIASGLAASGSPSNLLVTMDSYVEERSSDQILDHGVNPEPKGLRVAQAMAKDAGLDNIDHVIGSSPVDVPKALAGRLTQDPYCTSDLVVNLAFIDGHHLNGQPLKDWEAIRPWMEPSRAIVLLHDTHVPDVKEALRAVEAWAGVTHFHPGLPGFNLVAVCADRGIINSLEHAVPTCRRLADIYS